MKNSFENSRLYLHKSIRLHLLVFVVIFSLVLGACGGPPPAQQPSAEAPTAPQVPVATEAPAVTQAPAKAPQVTISYWFYPEFNAVPGFENVSKEYGDWERYQAEQFMKLNPNVKVETNLLPWGEGYQTVLNAIAAGTPPDIMREYIVRAAQYQSLGVTDDLSKDITAADKTDFGDANLALWSWNNQLIGLPHFGYNGMVVVNKDLFKKAGAENLLPTGPGRNWSYDQFMEAARAITKLPDTYAVTFPSGDQTADNFIRMWMGGFGAQLFNDDYKSITINGPQGIKGLQWMVDTVNQKLTPPGAASEDYYTAFNLFIEGKVGMIAGAPFTWGEVAAAFKDKNLPPFELYGVNFPSEKGDKYPVVMGPTGIVMFKQSDPVKREWVAKYVQFLASAENQATECKAANQFSYRKSLESLVQGKPGLEDAMAILTYNGFGDYGIRNSKYNKVRPVFFPEIQAALLGAKTPEQALNDFAKAANEILSQ